MCSNENKATDMHLCGILETCYRLYNSILHVEGVDENLYNMRT